MTKWQKQGGGWLPILRSQDFTAVTARISRWKNEVHGRPEGTASRNFRANRNHFIENEDYFKICADEIRRHKIMDISPKTHEDIILITESGYLMLVKSFDD